MHTAKLTAALLVLAALAFSAAPAQAETVNCTPITSLPAIITVQGVYCFTGDLSTAIAVGNAIDIQTNNVVLDLNGFKLGGLAAGPSTAAYGIRASNRQNITIRTSSGTRPLRLLALAPSPRLSATAALWEARTG